MRARLCVVDRARLSVRAKIKFAALNLLDMDTSINGNAATEERWFHFLNDDDVAARGESIS